MFNEWLSRLSCRLHPYRRSIIAILFKDKKKLYFSNETQILRSAPPVTPAGRSSPWAIAHSSLRAQASSSPPQNIPRQRALSFPNPAHAGCHSNSECVDASGHRCGNHSTSSTHKPKPVERVTQNFQALYIHITIDFLSSRHVCCRKAVFLEKLYELIPRRTILVMFFLLIDVVHNTMLLRFTHSKCSISLLPAKIPVVCMQTFYPFARTCFDCSHKIG